MTTNPLNHWRLALIPAAAAVLMACASTPPTNAALEEARAVYAQAAADVYTARSAPLDLRRAQEALTRAEEAHKQGDDAQSVAHYAYLARQRATTALQSGEVARAELAVTEAAKQRDRILLDARTRSAEASAADALKANENARQQQAEAERAREQAVKARQEAEAQLAAAQAAQAKAAKLQQQLTDLQAQQTDRGMVLTLGDVLFDTGRAVLKSGAMVTIDRLAAFMKDNPERTLVVEGHTDSVGSDAFNLTLSQQRADAVKSALSMRGVDGNRVTTEGFGKARPVASNDTAEGRQRNRRVEVVISNAS